VVVVDNASTDGSADGLALPEAALAVVRNPANHGFARACNQGAAAAAGAYLLFLNPDARVEIGSVETLARALDEEAAVGIVGPRTLNEDGTPQVSFGPALGLVAEWRQRRLVRGVRRRDPAVLRRVEGMSATPSDPDWVSGSCLMMRRRAFEQVGGFDEAFFLYEEDVDLCVRARAAGWRVRYEPRAVVRHDLGRSMARLAARARLEYHRSHLRYYRKHGGALETALLRVRIVLESIAGWIGAAVRRDESERNAHSDALRLAIRGQG
jgi:GT2 family glycosyltransferase